MCYSVMDIAKYTINRCIDLDRPITNLQLQKILYYIQGEYMKFNNGNLLFQDVIIATKYGAMIPNVYYKFNQYSSSNIYDTQEINITIESNVKKIIDPVIINKSKLSSWKLVEDNHNELPWKKTFKNGGEIISNSIMEEFFYIINKYF